MIMEYNDDELFDIQEDKRWARKAFLTVGCIVAVIIWVCGLLFGKIVEATLFEEIAKWAVMGIALGVLVAALCYVPITMLRGARRKYFPIYGKSWFKMAFKKEILGK